MASSICLQFSIHPTACPAISPTHIETIFYPLAAPFVCSPHVFADGPIFLFMQNFSRLRCTAHTHLLPVSFLKLSIPHGLYPVSEFLQAHFIYLTHSNLCDVSSCPVSRQSSCLVKHTDLCPLS